MVLLLTRLPDALTRFLQVAGGLLVIYLAWKSFQSWRSFDSTRTLAEAEKDRTLWSAVGINFLSPGPYIFWSLISGPVLVRGWQQSPAHGVIFLGGFYLAMVGGLAVLVVLFGAARQLGPRANRALLGISALALLGFGLYQLWQGITG
jgi:threonine/homoserine/homoserine lactone efflux protein